MAETASVAAPTTLSAAAPMADVSGPTPTPAPGPGLGLQISQAVAQLAVKDASDRLVASAVRGPMTATVQLKPEHLGELDLKIARREDGRLEITMRAVHESTQRSLEREVDRLVQNLSRHDLEVHHVQVRPLVIEASMTGDDTRFARDARQPLDQSPRDPRERTSSDPESRSGQRRSRRHPGQFDAEA